ncbi:MAG: type II secretion system GspH family protein [Lentisphaeraceae bacterium]|nr:type II secretion system GspH family protein [Lentisphaeraceae bacterium]
MGGKLKRHTFTLIELLVVVAIIGILMSLLLPSLKKARLATKSAVSKSNLKQIYTAGIMYVDQNNGYLCKADNNSHPNGNNISYPRMFFEAMQGERFSNNSGECTKAMKNGAYYKIMFCPVLRENRGSVSQHKTGRADYSMNLHFRSNQNISQLVGKDEPFLVPGGEMPSTQASPYFGHSAPSFEKITYKFVNQQSIANYIDGSVRPFTRNRGNEVESLVSERNNFE